MDSLFDRLAAYAEVAPTSCGVLASPTKCLFGGDWALLVTLVRGRRVGRFPRSTRSSLCRHRTLPAQLALSAWTGSIVDAAYPVARSSPATSNHKEACTNGSLVL